jgi:hypothetical protein
MTLSQGTTATTGRAYYSCHWAYCTMLWKEMDEAPTILPCDMMYACLFLFSWLFMTFYSVLLQTAQFHWLRLYVKICYSALSKNNDSSHLELPSISHYVWHPIVLLPSGIPYNFARYHTSRYPVFRTMSGVQMFPYNLVSHIILPGITPQGTQYFKYVWRPIVLLQFGIPYNSAWYYTSSYTEFHIVSCIL